MLNAYIEGDGNVTGFAGICSQVNMCPNSNFDQMIAQDEYHPSYISFCGVNDSSSSSPNFMEILPIAGEKFSLQSTYCVNLMKIALGVRRGLK